MEEIQEGSEQQEPKRQVTTYSPELKLSLLGEYRSVAGKTSIAQFAREHGLCLTTFYGWMKKAGIKGIAPSRRAVDVRSMIPMGQPHPVSQPLNPPQVKKAETKQMMIPITLNGNELMTTPEGIGIIISSLKKCSR